MKNIVKSVYVQKKICIVLIAKKFIVEDFKRFINK